MNSQQPDKAKELWQFRSFLIRQAQGITGQFGGKINSSDLVQQTLLEAYHQLDQFRGRTEGELAKWLNQMLSNNITDAARAMRRQKRDIAREQPLDKSGPGSAVGAANWIASEQTSPSNCVHNAEQLLQLSQAISELPVAQQEVVVLHHLRGHSLAEVAGMVNRSQAAVAGLLYRGLKSLRSSLADS